MTSEPLLLAARELVRGSMASLPAQVEVVALAASANHLAVLFSSPTEPYCVRLGVFKTDEDTVDAEAVELIELESEKDDVKVIITDPSRWTLVWSPDLKYLIVSGQISRSKGAAEGVLWLVARSEWLLSTAPSKDIADPPLLLRIDLSKYLTPKLWNPATCFVNVFFPSQSGSHAFVVSNDGQWLQLSVQVAKLVLMAMEKSTLNEPAEILRIKMVKDLNEWHAGITAACYDPQSHILVLSGGVRDPSVDLVQNQASSLSVWKVASEYNEKEPGELLDFTMILKGHKLQPGDESEEDETEGCDYVAEETQGLVACITSTLFFPLKMMIGRGKTTTNRIMEGSIRQLAVSPDGSLVSMVDDRGWMAIRQIDACADVIKWQQVEENDSTFAMQVGIKMVVWLTSEIVALVLRSNRIVFSRFNSHTQEEMNDKENNAPSLYLELVPVKYCRPACSNTSHRIQTLAFNVNGNGEQCGASFTAVEVVKMGDHWALNQVQTMETTAFIDLLVRLEQFDDALDVIAAPTNDASDVNADTIYRGLWLRFCQQAARKNDKDNDDDDDDHPVPRIHVPHRQELLFLTTRGDREAFLTALDHLRAITDKQWVLEEGLRVIIDDSSANMKKLLDLAWNALTSLEDDDEESVTNVAQHRETLQRYVYRLETLRMIFCAEDGVSFQSVTSDCLFDGASYARFRSLSLVTIAKQLAVEGRVKALQIVVSRHGYNVLPKWLEILQHLPPLLEPSTYAALLPAIANGIKDHHVYCFLKWPNDWPLDDDTELVALAPLLDENQRYDLTDTERLTFEEHRNMGYEAQYAEYEEWFRERILEVDTLYGQLAIAYEWSQLASMCMNMSTWPSTEAKRPLEALIDHTERLYKSVHVCHVSSCSFLPLENWIALSMDEQARIIVGLEAPDLAGNVPVIMDRLETIFVATRRDQTHAFDEFFSSFVQSITSQSSLASLTLATAFIERSKPSINVATRWIQSNARLIATALDIIYSVKVVDMIEKKPHGMDSTQCHLLLVEQLWTIFQSLPVRNATDAPELAPLQAAVDEVEDLLIAVDVLMKYNVMTSPKELKLAIQASNEREKDTNSRPLDVLEEMCAFAFSSNEIAWLEVLQDAAKLKEHAFGERWSQELILDVVWKHLLMSEQVSTTAVREMALHWIALDVDARDHVLELLFKAMRSKLDTCIGYSDDLSTTAGHKHSAFSYMNIIREILALPVWDHDDRAGFKKEQYEASLSLELDTAHACELLDLMTYGALKMSPGHFRTSKSSQEDREYRIQAVVQVLKTNPTNYKPSSRAKEWLMKHQNASNTTASAWTDREDPLAVILYVAKLLRVDAFKLELAIQSAYAALYCMDYEIAFDVTMEIMQELAAIEMEPPIERQHQPLPLQPLISLVLDLVSMPSFRSWEKKRLLCCALFSATSLSSSDLFDHEMTDVILSWMAKIDAIEALKHEVGLSDDEVEARRLASGKGSVSVESVLFQELQVVRELLSEEEKEEENRHVLLRLLQRGLELTLVLSTDLVRGETLDSSDDIVAYLEQMVPLCMQEAWKLVDAPTAIELPAWRPYMELGCSYLMVLSDLCTDEDQFQAFCTQNVLSFAVTDHQEPSSAVLVRHLHHFFLLQASQGIANAVETSVEEVETFRERFESVSSCYERAQSVERSTTGADKWLVMSEMRYNTYIKLADRCQERLVLQQKSHEWDQLSAFLTQDVDLTRFSHESDYRRAIIMQLAMKKASLSLSRQFASKYGIDEYECVLMYIKSVLVAPVSSKMSNSWRRKQLDQALTIEHVDLVDEALRRPISFGTFLLTTSSSRDELSVYDRINGTDQVALLLVLRMVLECSKRIEEEEEKDGKQSLFPLSKASIDRITLLFMCWKKLHAIQNALDSEPVENVDFKLLGAASTTSELVTPVAFDAPSMASKRQVAIQAVQPLLTPKTIKLVTKILRKLHHVTSSAMVLIFLNQFLTKRWQQEGLRASNSSSQRAEVAFHAFESCVPFFKVLSHDHLMLFYVLFLDTKTKKTSLPAVIAHLNLADECYGQELNGFEPFGALLTPQHRVQLVSKTLFLFQSRLNSWQASSGHCSNVSSASSSTSSTSVSWDPIYYKQREQEVQYLERQVVETTCLLLLYEIKQSGLVLDSKEQSLTVAIEDWFAMDPLEQATKDHVLTWILDELCQSVASIDLTTLFFQLFLRTSGTNANEMIVQSYQRAVKHHINHWIDEIETADWVERLVWTWVTGIAAPCSQETKLGAFLEAITGMESSIARGIYQRMMKTLAESPSSLLHEIGSNRIEETEKSLNTLIQEAVQKEYEATILVKEKQHKWMQAAVLSHILVSHTPTKRVVSSELTRWNFGLHVKAVWSALGRAFEMVAIDTDVFDVPSCQLSSDFDAVFEQLLASMEACLCPDNAQSVQFAEVATVALSNLLLLHDEATEDVVKAESIAAWQEEQKRAMETRIQAQFQLETAGKRPSPTQQDRGTKSWVALFVRGQWGHRLVSWYTSCAFVKLLSAKEAMENVIETHWKAGKSDTALQLLLMCPFDDLRVKHGDRLLLAVRDLPRDSFGWNMAIELTLLRFNMALLLQYDLHASIVAFVVQETRHMSTLWTSSGPYVVCAFVALDEVAAASRLACALCHTHPLLWDIENSRLVLATYLQSLSIHHHNNHNKKKMNDMDMALSQLQHDVYVQTLNRFAARQR